MVDPVANLAVHDPSSAAEGGETGPLRLETEEVTGERWLGPLLRLLIEPWTPGHTPQQLRLHRNQAALSLLMAAWCLAGIWLIPRYYAGEHGPVELLPGATVLFVVSYVLSRLTAGPWAGILLVGTQMLLPFAHIFLQHLRDAHQVAMSLTWGMSGLLIGSFVVSAPWLLLALGAYMGAAFWLPGVEAQGPLLAAPLIGGMGIIIYLSASMWQRDLRRHDARHEALRRQRSELRQAHGEVLRLNRQKDELLSVVSHELRTPLTAIKAAVRLIPEPEGEEGDEDDFYLAIIRSNTDRLASIIEDLLDISRMDLGEMKYRHDEGDLAELAMLMATSLESVYVERQLQLSLDLRPTPAWFDEGRMAQVIQNLLSNAAKFTPTPGTVTVRVRPADGGARMEVTDTGIGIPSEHLEQIFSKFFQVDASTTRSQGGTGLGLAICKAIVEQGHGGRIHAEGLVGGGTRIVVTLPPRAPLRS